MNCQKCGMMQKDNAKFCTCCGQVLQTEQEAEEAKKNKRKGWMITALVVGAAVIVIVVISIVVNSIFDPCNQVVTSLAEGAYGQALEYAQTIEEPTDRFVKKLTDRMEKIEEAYVAKEMEYALVLKELDTIQKMKIESKEVNRTLSDVKSAVVTLQESRVEYEQGKIFFEKGQYDKAILHFKNVIETDANYENALETTEKSIKLYREEAMRAAADCVLEDDYVTALNTLNDALEVLVEDTEITRQIALYSVGYEEKALKISEDYMQQKKYSEAFSKLEEAKKLLEDDTTLDKALEEHRTAYEKSVLSEVDGLLGEKKFDEAETLLGEALKVLPYSQIFKDKLNGVDDLRPVGLETIILIDSYRYEYISGVFTDSFGNTYDGVHYYTDLYKDDEPRSLFNLNNQYKTFSGSIVATPKTNSDWSYFVNIYVDGVLKFSKTGITKISGKTDFEIDVRNGEVLRIIAGLEGGTGDWDQEIGIVNAELSKY